MKKFTILVALILCLTISGVYATWNYGGGNVSEEHRHIEVLLAHPDNSAAKGEFDKVTNSLDITLDDTNNDYEAEVVVGGYLEFIFTPKTNASDDVQTNGVNLVYTLGQTNPAIEYGGENVFTINSAAVTLGKGEKITDQNVATLSKHGLDLTGCIGSFYYCIEASDIQGKITTNVSLPTYDDYTELSGILSTTQGKIGITIAEMQTGI